MDSPFIGSDGRHHFPFQKWKCAGNHLDRCRATKQCRSGSPDDLAGVVRVEGFRLFKPSIRCLLTPLDKLLFAATLQELLISSTQRN